MQGSTTGASQLKREIRIVIPTREIDELVDQELAQSPASQQVPGFRPGKVPLRILRQRFGPRIREGVLQRELSQRAERAIENEGIHPAFMPELRAEEGGGDDNALAFTLSVLALPKIDPIDFSAFELERLVVEPAAEQVQQDLEELARNQVRYETIDEDRPSRTGDRLLVSFRAGAGEEPYAPLDGRDIPVDLDEEVRFPELRDELLGAKAGEERAFRLTFPGPEPGEEVSVDVEATVTAVQASIEVKPDDQLAELMGCANLEELRGLVLEQRKNGYRMRSDQKFSVDLMDRLVLHADFEVPEELVDSEYERIRRSLAGEAQGPGEASSPEASSPDVSSPDESVPEESTPDEVAPDEMAPDAGIPAAEPDGGDGAAEAGPAVEESVAAEAVPPAAGADDEEAAAGEPAPDDAESYRAIARRRVKLALLLKEIGRQNNITVQEHEVEEGVRAWVSQFPPHYQADSYRFARENPEVLENITGRAFEKKVVDYISEMATISERSVTAEELEEIERAAEEEDAT